MRALERFAIVSLLVGTYSSATSAQPAIAFSELLTEGVRLRRERRDQEALKLFQKLHQLAPQPRVTAQLALAEQALGHWSKAATYFRAALKHERDEWIIRHRAHLERAQAMVDSRLVTLSVRCNVPSAELFVNGAAHGKLRPEPIFVDEGLTTLELRAPGYVKAQTTLELRGGSTLRQTFNLFKRAPPVATGRSSPGSTNLGQPARTLMPTAPDGDRDEQRQMLAAGLLGGGTVLLAVGVVTHVFREQRLAIYNDDSRCFHGSLSRDERCGGYRQEADLATWLAVFSYAGSALAIGSGTYLLLGPSSAASAPRARTRYDWRLSLGAGLEGRF